MFSKPPSLEGVYEKAQFYKYLLLYYCDIVLTQNVGFLSIT